MSEPDHIRAGKRIFGSLIQPDRLPGQYESGTYFSHLKATYPGYDEKAWQTQAGNTGWTVSRLGMGTYRMQRDNREHYDALREALISGTNVIDTSANYMDGSAESLIGDVIRDLKSAGRIQRENIAIVTKAGYIQGKNSLLCAEVDFPEQTRFDRSLAHCIHPDFLENQIELSRLRMGLETLDVILLHNPEYYLKKARQDEVPADEAQKEYYRRIHQAFDYLEDYYPDGVKEFRRMMDRQGIDLPRNLIGDVTDEQMETMVDVALVLEPLWENALGKDWKSIMTRQKIRDLYLKM